MPLITATFLYGFYGILSKLIRVTFGSFFQAFSRNIFMLLFLFGNILGLEKELLETNPEEGSRVVYGHDPAGISSYRCCFCGL